MCDSRRSGRAKKTIDYTAFGGGGDSDEDFADPTPPPSKKPKTDRMKEKKKKEKSKKDLPSAKPRKARPPLDDKLFDRDLELALQLSREESQQSQSENEEQQYRQKRQKQVAVVVHSTENTTAEKDIPQSDSLLLQADPSNDKEQPSPDPLRSGNNIIDNKENISNKEIERTSRTQNSPSNVSKDEDPITVIETLEGSDVERGGRRKRKAASAAVAKQRGMISDDEDESDGDDEFKADEFDDLAASDSDDDDFDDGDADSDFDEGATKKQKKGKTPKSKKKSPRSNSKSVGKKKTSSAKGKADTPATKRIQPPTNRAPVLKSPITPVVRPKVPVRGFTPPAVCGEKKLQQTIISSSQSAVRKPSWCSPPSSGSSNNPLGGVKLVSPSNPLRLGLSRYARIKPLHPNATHS